MHCHPPHATAFAVAREPIPKCVLPEVEVFLGEVAISPYETPGGQKFADTVLPFVKDTETILLANHGTVTFGTDLEDAYFKTEIIDAYCRILILAKQLGRVNYYTDEKAAELIKLKPKLGIPDPRLTRGSRTATSAATACSARATATSAPSPRSSSIPRSLAERPAVADRGVACPVPSQQPAPAATAASASAALVQRPRRTDRTSMPWSRRSPTRSCTP